MSGWRARALTAVLGAGAVAGAAGQAGPPAVVLQVGEVTAVAPPARQGLAVALAEAADQVQTWPGLGRRAAGALRLVVVEDSAAMRRASRGQAPAWGAGLAFPQSRTVVVRADAGDPLRVLRHELAHLVLRDAVRVRVPLWFDEGYATLASGGVSAFDAVGLHMAVLRGAVPDLAGLDRALRGASADAELAYALAATAVAALGARQAADPLGPLLERLGAGTPFEEAVLATTGLSTGRFEAAWRKGLRQRYGWLGWLAAGGVWLVALVALAVGWWWRRERDAPRRAALDEGWPLPPDDDAGAPPGAAEPPNLDPVSRKA